MRRAPPGARRRDGRDQVPGTTRAKARDKPRDNDPSRVQTHELWKRSTNAPMNAEGPLQGLPGRGRSVLTTEIGCSHKGRCTATSRGPSRGKLLQAESRLQGGRYFILAIDRETCPLGNRMIRNGGYVGIGAQAHLHFDQTAGTGGHPQRADSRKSPQNGAKIRLVRAAALTDLQSERIKSCVRPPGNGGFFDFLHEVNRTHVRVKVRVKIRNRGGNREQNPFRRPTEGQSL